MFGQQLKPAASSALEANNVIVQHELFEGVQEGRGILVATGSSGVFSSESSM
jgi:hypothetical protein